MGQVETQWKGRSLVIEELTIAAPAAHTANAAAPAAVTSAAPAALTSGQEATANAAVQGVGYVQADVQSIATLANSLKTRYNAVQADLATGRTERGLVQADVAALQTEVAANTTAINNLLAALQAAGLQL